MLLGEFPFVYGILRFPNTQAECVKYHDP